MSDARRSPQPITVLDLFAGCGGLTEGFHQFRPAAGSEPVFRSVGAVEWDGPAAASYEMNFGASSPRKRYFEPPEVFCRDIVGWEPGWMPGEVEVVVGGPPCQGFSGLNRNRVGADRNTLWQEFIRVVVALRPSVFVIENVDRFVRSPEFADLQERIGNGDLTDYQLVEAPESKADDTDRQRARRYLLNAADYGAIQARRRAIVIGVRGNTDEDPRVERMQYPARTHIKDALDHQSTLKEMEFYPTEPKPWQTVDRLFGETEELGLTGTDLPPVTADIGGIEVPGPFMTSQLHFTRRPEAVSLARYEAIPPGGNRKDLRGRYACWLDDGSSMIIQRCNSYRDDTGELLVSGQYVAVVDGEATTKRYTVVDHVPVSASDARRSTRGKAEVFIGTVRRGRKEFRARLEYLSTPSWDSHDTGAGDVMGRMRLGAPSVTIRTEFFKPEKGRYLHPTAHRPITHYEAAMIQGFPDDFRWCGSKTAIARQIGNAVPIPLGRAIAGAIYEYLRPS